MCSKPADKIAAETTFHFDGQKYREASSHQKEWGHKLIRELKLSGSERILDLGCGDGALTAALASRVPAGSVLGLDSSPSMLEAATQWSGPNLKFELQDISQLAYQEEFDVLFSNSALHWIKDHHRLFPRLLRALKAGGIMRFNFPAAGNSASFERTIRELMALPQYAPYFRGFDWPWYTPAPENYRQLLGQFPSRELQVYGENADRFFPDVETLVRWIDQPCLVPFLPRLPANTHQQFRAEVLTKMIQTTRQADGRCFEVFRRIHVFCRK